TKGWVAVGPSAPDAMLTKIVSGLDEGVLYHWRTRVLHAPARATKPGITLPAEPSHGPWRRFTAQGVAADVRVIPEPGALVQLVSGIAALSLITRSRRAGRRVRRPD